MRIARSATRATTSVSEAELFSGVVSCGAVSVTVLVRLLPTATPLLTRASIWKVTLPPEATLIGTSTRSPVPLAGHSLSASRRKAASPPAMAPSAPGARLPAT